MMTKNVDYGKITAVTHVPFKNPLSKLPTAYEKSKIQYETLTNQPLSKEQGLEITKMVQKELEDRAKAGLSKYGVSLDRTDLTVLEWLQHAKEEALDLAGYLQKIIVTLGGK